jgi:serine/threonine-protein kinase
LASCPDRSALEAFLLGKLPESGLDTLAVHVTACPRCTSTLRELQTEDALLSRLQKCFRPQDLIDEAGCAQLEAAARVIALSSSLHSDATVSDSVASHAPGAPPTTPELLKPNVPREPPLPTAVGPYEIVAKLGEAGMGVVYKARHIHTRKVAALKMVRAGAHAGTQALARFRIEAKAIAKLDHPNVVRIFEVGEHEGLPYYSMELMERGNLAAQLRQGLPAAREAANLVRLLAGAMACAHQANVLHRDLKPANILLTTDGSPKVADFGLAKLLDEESGQTVSGMVLGTAPYMAPEQAEARAPATCPAPDVYALGAILYEALTGRPPFRGKTSAETLRQVIKNPLVPPRQLRPEVPRVLEAICVKCLEKAPGKRYQTAQALADDLGRWLRGEPTEARPPRWPARAGRWVLRHAVALAVATVLCITLAVLYWRDPQRTLEQIYAELSRGRPVTLLGPTGEPKWYRSRGGLAAPGLAADGTFAISTWSGLCLLELLPDPQQDKYRISAQVRHRDADSPGRCGLFFGRQVAPGAQAGAYLCTFLHFNDIVSAMDVVERNAAKIPEKIRQKMIIPARNPVQLESLFYSDAIEGPRIEPPFALVSGAMFAPKGKTGPHPWHKLEVIVTPVRIEASWDGRSVGMLSVEEFTTRAQHNFAQLRAKFPAQVSLYPEPPQALPTRGGLGLSLSYGSATFREVVVTPLDGLP